MTKRADAAATVATAATDPSHVISSLQIRLPPEYGGQLVGILTSKNEGTANNTDTTTTKTMTLGGTTLADLRKTLTNLRDSNNSNRTGNRGYFLIPPTIHFAFQQRHRSSSDNNKKDIGKKYKNAPLDALAEDTTPLSALLALAPRGQTKTTTTNAENGKEDEDGGDDNDNDSYFSTSSAAAACVMGPSWGYWPPPEVVVVARPGKATSCAAAAIIFVVPLQQQKEKEKETTAEEASLLEEDPLTLARALLSSDPVPNLCINNNKATTTSTSINTAVPPALFTHLNAWNVHLKDSLGRTILHEMAAQGNVAAVNFLLWGSSSTNTHNITTDNNTTTLSSGGGEDGKGNGNGNGNESKSGGLAEAAAGAPPIVAWVDALDNSGRTPLHWAALKGHTAVVAALLACNNSSTSHSSNSETQRRWRCPWSSSQVAATGTHTTTGEGGDENNNTKNVKNKKKENKTLSDFNAAVALCRASVTGGTALQQQQPLIVNPLQPDFNGESALLIAVRRRDDATTQRLLDALQPLLPTTTTATCCVCAAAVDVLRWVHMAAPVVFFGASTSTLPPQHPTDHQTTRLIQNLKHSNKTLKRSSSSSSSSSNNTCGGWRWPSTIADCNVVKCFQERHPTPFEVAANGTPQSLEALLGSPLFQTPKATTTTTTTKATPPSLLRAAATGEGLLHSAVAANNAPMVKFLLLQQQQQQQQNEKKNSFLHVLSLPAADHSGQTALHYACRHGHLDALDALLEYITTSSSTCKNHHAEEKDDPSSSSSSASTFILDPNASDLCGRTALLTALLHKHPRAAERLLRALLAPAAAAPSTTSLLLLTSSVTRADADGVTALHAAAAMGATAVVTLLIEVYGCHPAMRVALPSRWRPVSPSLSSIVACFSNEEEDKEGKQHRLHQVTVVAAAPEKTADGAGSDSQPSSQRSQQQQQQLFSVTTIGPTPLVLALQGKHEATAREVLRLEGGGGGASLTAQQQEVVAGVVDLTMHNGTNNKTPPSFHNRLSSRQVKTTATTSTSTTSTMTTITSLTAAQRYHQRHAAVLAAVDAGYLLLAGDILAAIAVDTGLVEEGNRNQQEKNQKQQQQHPNALLKEDVALLAYIVGKCSNKRDNSSSDDDEILLRLGDKMVTDYGVGSLHPLGDEDQQKGMQKKRLCHLISLCRDGNVTACRFWLESFFTDEEKTSLSAEGSNRYVVWQVLYAAQALQKEVKSPSANHGKTQCPQQKPIEEEENAAAAAISDTLVALLTDHPYGAPISFQALHVDDPTTTSTAAVTATPPSSDLIDPALLTPLFMACVTGREKTVRHLLLRLQKPLSSSSSFASSSHIRDCAAVLWLLLHVASPLPDLTRAAAAVTKRVQRAAPTWAVPCPFPVITAADVARHDDMAMVLLQSLLTDTAASATTNEDKDEAPNNNNNNNNNILFSPLALLYIGASKMAIFPKLLRALIARVVSETDPRILRQWRQCLLLDKNSNNDNDKQDNNENDDDDVNPSPRPSPCLFCAVFAAFAATTTTTNTATSLGNEDETQEILAVNNTTHPTQEGATTMSLQDDWMPLLQHLTRTGTLVPVACSSDATDYSTTGNRRLAKNNKNAADCAAAARNVDGLILCAAHGVLPSESSFGTTAAGCCGRDSTCLVPLASSLSFRGRLATVWTITQTALRNLKDWGRFINMGGMSSSSPHCCTSAATGAAASSSSSSRRFFFLHAVMAAGQQWILQQAWTSDKGEDGEKCNNSDDDGVGDDRPRVPTMGLAWHHLLLLAAIDNGHYSTARAWLEGTKQQQQQQHHDDEAGATTTLGLALASALLRPPPPQRPQKSDHSQKEDDDYDFVVEQLIIRLSSAKKKDMINAKVLYRRPDQFPAPPSSSASSSSAGLTEVLVRLFGSSVLKHFVGVARRAVAASASCVRSVVDVGASPLMLAVLGGRLANVRCLLRHGAQPPSFVSNKNDNTGGAKKRNNDDEEEDEEEEEAGDSVLSVALARAIRLVTTAFPASFTPPNSIIAVTETTAAAVEASAIVGTLLDHLQQNEVTTSSASSANEMAVVAITSIAVAQLVSRLPATLTTTSTTAPATTKRTLVAMEIREHWMAVLAGAASHASSARPLPTWQLSSSSSSPSSVLSAAAVAGARCLFYPAGLRNHRHMLHVFCRCAPPSSGEVGVGESPPQLHVDLLRQCLSLHCSSMEDLMLADGSGRSPLGLAIRQCHHDFHTTAKTTASSSSMTANTSTFVVEKILERAAALPTSSTTSSNVALLLDSICDQHAEWTPLMAAAAIGESGEAIVALILKTMKVNASSQDDFCKIIDSIRNVKDRKGCSALWLACASGSLKTLQHLQSAFQQASSSTSSFGEALLTPSKEDEEDQDGSSSSPLHCCLASSGGHDQTALALLCGHTTTQSSVGVYTTTAAITDDMLVASLSAPSSLPSSRGGGSLLHAAARGGCVAVIRHWTRQAEAAEAKRGGGGGGEGLGGSSPKSSFLHALSSWQQQQQRHRNGNNKSSEEAAVHQECQWWWCFLCRRDDALRHSERSTGGGGGLSPLLLAWAMGHLDVVNVILDVIRRHVHWGNHGGGGGNSSQPPSLLPSLLPADQSMRTTSSTTTTTTTTTGQTQQPPHQRSVLLSLLPLDIVGAEERALITAGRCCDVPVTAAVAAATEGEDEDEDTCSGGGENGGLSWPHFVCPGWLAAQSTAVVTNYSDGSSTQLAADASQPSLKPPPPPPHLLPSEWLRYKCSLRDSPSIVHFCVQSANHLLLRTLQRGGLLDTEWMGWGRSNNNNNNSNGKTMTILQWAAKNKQTALVRQLLSAPSCFESEKKEPSFSSSPCQTVSVLEGVFLRDHKGRTALELCVSHAAHLSPAAAAATEDTACFLLEYMKKRVAVIQNSNNGRIVNVSAQQENQQPQPQPQWWLEWLLSSLLPRVCEVPLPKLFSGIIAAIEDVIAADFTTTTQHIDQLYQTLLHCRSFSTHKTNNNNNKKDKKKKRKYGGGKNDPNALELAAMSGSPAMVLAVAAACRRVEQQRRLEQERQREERKDSPPQPQSQSQGDEEETAAIVVRPYTWRHRCLAPSVRALLLQEQQHQQQHLSPLLSPEIIAPPECTLSVLEGTGAGGGGPQNNYYNNNDDEDRSSNSSDDDSSDDESNNNIIITPSSYQHQQQRLGDHCVLAVGMAALDAREEEEKEEERQQQRQQQTTGSSTALTAALAAAKAALEALAASTNSIANTNNGKRKRAVVASITLDEAAVASLLKVAPPDAVVKFLRVVAGPGIGGRFFPSSEDSEEDEDEEEDDNEDEEDNSNNNFDDAPPLQQLRRQYQQFRKMEPPRAHIVIRPVVDVLLGTTKASTTTTTPKAAESVGSGNNATPTTATTGRASLTITKKEDGESKNNRYESYSVEDTVVIRLHAEGTGRYRCVDVDVAPLATPPATSSTSATPASTSAVGPCCSSSSSPSAAQLFGLSPRPFFPPGTQLPLLVKRAAAAAAQLSARLQQLPFAKSYRPLRTMTVDVDWGAWASASSARPDPPPLLNEERERAAEALLYSSPDGFGFSRLDGNSCNASTSKGALAPSVQATDCPTSLLNRVISALTDAGYDTNEPPQEKKQQIKGGGEEEKQNRRRFCIHLLFHPLPPGEDHGREQDHHQQHHGGGDSTTTNASGNSINNNNNKTLPSAEGGATSSSLHATPLLSARGGRSPSPAANPLSLTDVMIDLDSSQGTLILPTATANPSTATHHQQNPFNESSSAAAAAVVVAEETADMTMIVIPFCALGIGRPVVRCANDDNGRGGCVVLQPVLGGEPLRTYLAPLWAAIESDGICERLPQRLLQTAGQTARHRRGPHEKLVFLSNNNDDNKKKKKSDDDGKDGGSRGRNETSRPPIALTITLAAPSTFNGPEHAATATRVVERLDTALRDLALITNYTTTTTKTVSNDKKDAAASITTAPAAAAVIADFLCSLAAVHVTLEQPPFPLRVRIEPLVDGKGKKNNNRKGKETTTSAAGRSPRRIIAAATHNNNNSNSNSSSGGDSNDNSDESSTHPPPPRCGSGHGRTNPVRLAVSVEAVATPPPPPPPTTSTSTSPSHHYLVSSSSSVPHPSELLAAIHAQVLQKAVRMNDNNNSNINTTSTTNTTTHGRTRTIRGAVEAAVGQAEARLASLLQPPPPQQAVTAAEQDPPNNSTSTTSSSYIVPIIINGWSIHNHNHNHTGSGSGNTGNTTTAAAAAIVDSSSSSSSILCCGGLGDAMIATTTAAAAAEAACVLHIYQSINDDQQHHSSSSSSSADPTATHTQLLDIPLAALNALRAADPLLFDACRRRIKAVALRAPRTVSPATGPVAVTLIPIPNTTTTATSDTTTTASTTSGSSIVGGSCSSGGDDNSGGNVLSIELPALAPTCKQKLLSNNEIAVRVVARLLRTAARQQQEQQTKTTATTPTTQRTYGGVVNRLAADVEAGRSLQL